MEKFAGIRPTIPEWYTDEIEKLEVPRNYGPISFVPDYLKFLREIVQSLRFRKTYRFLNDFNSNLKLINYYSLNVPADIIGQFNSLGILLKAKSTEYIYTNNSFYNEETRNPKELETSIKEIGSIFDRILSGFEQIKDDFKLKVQDQKLPNKAFGFINTLRGDVQNDIELALKNTQIWSEIYSGPIGRWNEKIDKYNEENPQKRKFKPEKLDEVPVNFAIGNLKQELSKKTDDAPWNRNNDKMRFFETFSTSIGALISGLAWTFKDLGFKTTASAIVNAAKIRGLKRYKIHPEYSADTVEDQRRNGSLAFMVKELDLAWKYFQAAIKSEKFPNDESTSIELQRSFEEMMKQMRQLQELVADANLGSYYRKISLAFIEDLASFV